MYSVPERGVPTHPPPPVPGGQEQEVRDKSRKNHQLDRPPDHPLPCLPIHCPLLHWCVTLDRRHPACTILSPTPISSPAPAPLPFFASLCALCGETKSQVVRATSPRMPITVATAPGLRFPLASVPVPFLRPFAHFAVRSCLK